MHLATVQGAHLEETNLVLFLPVVVIGILMSICSIRAIGSLADSRCWFACARAHQHTIERLYQHVFQFYQLSE